MNKYLSILLALLMVWLPLAPVAAGQTYQVGTLTAGSVNGVLFPARCGDTHAPTWCTGTTADAWIMAACAALPSDGGIVDWLGLTGNIVASLRGCSTPSRYVVFVQDPSHAVTITETDGDIAIPLDNSSIFLGYGVGQCLLSGGLHLSASANVTAMIGPAHTDGTQENMQVDGACIWGAVGATVSQGMLYSRRTFANTTFSRNVVSVCTTFCLKLVDVGETQVTDNWFNVTSGVNTIHGQPLGIMADGAFGTGCIVGPVTVQGGQMEHASFAAQEISISGDGAGALACAIRINDVGIERNPGGSVATFGVSVSDCWGCEVNDVSASGISTGGSADMVNVSQSAIGRTLNVSVTNANNVFGTYPNTVNDTTPGAPPPLTFAANPQVLSYVAQPGGSSASLHSVATNPLPTCAAGTQGQQLLVGDATSPTYLGAYASGGNITAQVICSYNGSTYGWVTH